MLNLLIQVPKLSVNQKSHTEEVKNNILGNLVLGWRLHGRVQAIYWDNVGLFCLQRSSINIGSSMFMAFKSQQARCKMQACFPFKKSDTSKIRWQIYLLLRPLYQSGPSPAIEVISGQPLLDSPVCSGFAMWQGKIQSCWCGWISIFLGFSLSPTISKAGRCTKQCKFVWTG